MPAVTRRQYKGAATQTTITNALASGDTSATLAATTGWPSTAAVPFFVVISPGTSSEEKCLATISGSVLTLTRAQDDTTATSHSSGATIYPVFSADDADDANKLASTMTTRGDLMTMGSGPDFARLAIGSSGTMLKSDGTDASWGQIVNANISSSASVDQQKLANATINDQSASYTLVVGDRFKRVIMNNASATTLTVPNSVFAAGDEVFIANKGAGTCTVTAGSGVTVNTAGSLALAQYGGGTLVALSASTFTFFSGAAAASTLTADYLIVAGGGGGARNDNGVFGGGGGGAGGMYTGTTAFAVGSRVVIVGAGGGNEYHLLGGDSGFDNIWAKGGGCVGRAIDGNSIPETGGSGGGGSAATGSAYRGLGTSGQGNDGGYSEYHSSGQYYGGGGGGGKGAAGANATTANGGAGGAGATNDYRTGSNVTYAVGGGGSGAAGGSGGAGGAGGGGAGKHSSSADRGDPGTANTGGGGGAAGQTTTWGAMVQGGNGGSGIVVIRYLTASAAGFTVTGGTITTVGSYTVHSFESTASFTVAK